MFIGKNCLGHATSVETCFKKYFFFLFQILPEALQHLPGEHELILAFMRETIYDVDFSKITISPRQNTIFINENVFARGKKRKISPAAGYTKESMYKTIN